ncbi:hypothetical protein FQN54_006954 [Arachnomyces sp. PD_36]|nr:hypothetical protein FQN54_006954 [Arachnomyces sp. PD_36]
METPTLPKTWQEGNCHCGAIRFRALLPPLTTTAASAAATTTPDADKEADNRHTVVDCDCSICTRNGLLNVFPDKDEVRVRLGNSSAEFTPGAPELRTKEAGLGYYMFGGKKLEHVFCLTCGSSVWASMVAEGPNVMAINVRMLRDVDVRDLRLKQFAGKNLDPVYNV